MTSTPTAERGILIALEGIDGSGKSTQAAALASWLEANGREVVRTKEPTNGPWGRRVRESQRTGRLPAREELECFLNDRREHVRELIAPALARGAAVVVDRYYYSTVAYQGARGMDPAELLALNRAFAPRPDLVVLMDLDPADSLARVRGRSSGPDHFEALEDLSAARAIFLALAREPHVLLVDARQPAEQVQREVRQRLMELRAHRAG